MIIIRWVRLQFRSRRSIEAENLVLRHQLAVLRVRSPKRVRVGFWNKMIFIALYRCFPTVLYSIHILQPTTILRWHRQGFRAYWRWKSGRKGGRPKIDVELRELIQQVSRENPLWGAPRIHGELLLLGYKVSETTVAKYMVKHEPYGGGQTWKTFLENNKEGIASMDFLIVPTIQFKLLYCLIIINHTRRRIIHCAVTTVPTSAWVAQQIIEAFPWNEAPQYMVRDNDPLFNVFVRRRLRHIGIRDRPTAPRSPWQNGYSERVNGTIRRECLDHILIFGEVHLRRVMRAYVEYYNNARTHLSLGKNSPVERGVNAEGVIQSVKHLGGLHHQYLRI